MNDQNPINPISPVVIVLALMLVGIEATLSLAGAGMVGGQTGVGWRIAAIEDYGFSPAVWDQLAERGDWSFEIVKRFVTYAFVHGSFTQALFGGALLLALGKFVGDVFHPAAVLAVFVVAVVTGAVVFGVAIDRNVPLYGVFPGVYGLIGAFTYLMWLKLGQMGANRYRAFQLIGFLLAIQLLFGFLFGGNPDWVAEVAGFVAGFALSVLVAPGGWSAFLDRLRDR